MRRREFINLLGAAAAWPLGAHAQQPERMRRIGVLLNLSENDVEAQRLIKAFRDGLAQSGWADGRNVRIDYRWAGGDVGRIRTFAKELVELSPDIMVGYATPSVIALGDPLYPHRVPIGHRPGWPRPRRELGTSGREYNGLCRIRVIVGYQVDGRSQTDSAQSQEGHHDLQSKNGAVLLTVLGCD